MLKTARRWWIIYEVRVKDAFNKICTNKHLYKLFTCCCCFILAYNATTIKGLVPWLARSHYMRWNYIIKKYLAYLQQTYTLHTTGNNSKRRFASIHVILRERVNIRMWKERASEKIARMFTIPHLRSMYFLVCFYRVFFFLHLFIFFRFESKKAQSHAFISTHTHSPWLQFSCCISRAL